MKERNWLIEIIEDLRLQQNPQEKQKDMEETIYVSLFDYLGKAAGAKLGKQVFEYSKIRNVKVMTKYVSNHVYTGQIICYPPSFLDEYFERKEAWTTSRNYFE